MIWLIWQQLHFVDVTRLPQQHNHFRDDGSGPDTGSTDKHSPHRPFRAKVTELKVLNKSEKLSHGQNDHMT